MLTTFLLVMQYLSKLTAVRLSMEATAVSISVNPEILQNTLPPGHSPSTFLQNNSIRHNVRVQSEHVVHWKYHHLHSMHCTILYMIEKSVRNECFRNQKQGHPFQTPLKLILQIYSSETLSNGITRSFKVTFSTVVK